MLSGRNKNALLAAIALIIAALIWSAYNASAWRLLLASALYLLLVAVPGKLMIGRLLPRLPSMHGWVFGSIIAEILLGIVLKLSNASLIAGIVFVLVCYLSWFARKHLEIAEPDDKDASPIAAMIGCVLAFVGLFLYAQAHRAGGSFYFAYNPTVDLTYFQTVLTSISNYGQFKDLAQLGYHFNYPDLGYQVLSFIHRLSGVEAFDLLFFFSPLKDLLLLLLGVFLLIRDHTARPWLAAASAISMLILGSRSLLELAILITNPAYREGLYMLIMLLWADGLERKWVVIAIALMGMVLTKPAIWIVAAPALLVAETLTAIRSKHPKQLGYLAALSALSAAVFYLLFSPTQSGLASSHYAITFGQGMNSTITSLSRIVPAMEFWRSIIIRPLGELAIVSVVLGLLVFVAFIVQQLQHSGRLLLSVISLFSNRAIGRLGLQLLLIILVSFGVLAFVGLEYVSFVHVYLWPLLLTCCTILLALQVSSLPVHVQGWRFALWRVLAPLAIIADLCLGIYGLYVEKTERVHTSVPAGVIDELRILRSLTDTSNVIATYDNGLFQPMDERSYLAAAFTERKILSEGSIYGSLIMGYQENSKDNTSPVRDTLSRRRTIRDMVFTYPDPNVVRTAARHYGVSHILIRHDRQEQIKAPIGDTIFNGRMLTLLKL